MNRHYEFLEHQREQMITLTQNNMVIQRSKSQEIGFKSKLFDRLGDMMISSGSWLKKSSRSRKEDHSVAFYSRIYKEG